MMAHWSNRLASDAPVPHDRCIGPCSAQATREGASSTGCTGGAKRAIGASTGGVFREPVKVVSKDSLGPDTPVPHQSNAPVQYQGSCGEKVQDRLNWCPTSALDRSNRWLVRRPND